LQREAGGTTLRFVRYDLEAAIGVLNGAIGDYLARTKNGLATPMTWARDGHARTSPGLEPPAGVVAVFVHGLMSTESVWELDDGSTYGSMLERDLGISPLYVRFNSGVHISDNGESLDALLERLARDVRPKELILIGHSMGGLVIRAATHVASIAGDRTWLPLVSKAIYVGSPHLGAPLERVGNVLTWALSKVGAAAEEPVSELVARLLAMRSDGVKDLRFGNLTRKDWEGVDADALLQNRRHPVPLLAEIRHHLVAATLVDEPLVSMFLGDALVPVHSASGRAEPHHRSPSFPPDHVRIFPKKNHLQIAHDLDVYAILRSWCEPT
jgi:pimeloyl-ACP methyl ester carboxylesterase